MEIRTPSSKKPRFQALLGLSLKMTNGLCQIKMPNGIFASYEVPIGISVFEVKERKKEIAHRLTRK